MANNILNFRAFFNKYGRSSSVTAQAANDDQSRVSDWSSKLEVPAYIRRSHWNAQQALALRGKQFNTTLNGVPAKKSNATSLNVFYTTPSQAAPDTQQQHLRLSGKMADVCSMLERMSITGSV